MFVIGAVHSAQSCSKAWSMHYYCALKNPQSYYIRVGHNIMLIRASFCLILKKSNRQVENYNENERR